jgi:hypothetical protein
MFCIYTIKYQAKVRIPYKVIEVLGGVSVFNKNRGVLWFER